MKLSLENTSDTCIHWHSKQLLWRQWECTGWWGANVFIEDSACIITLISPALPPLVIYSPPAGVPAISFQHCSWINACPQTQSVSPGAAVRNRLSGQHRLRSLGSLGKNVQKWGKELDLWTLLPTYVWVNHRVVVMSGLPSLNYKAILECGPGWGSWICVKISLGLFVFRVSNKV